MILIKIYVAYFKLNIIKSLCEASDFIKKLKIFDKVSAKFVI